MDLMQIRRQMMGVIAGMAGTSGAEFAKGTFTVPNDSSSYKVEFGKTFNKYLFYIEMADEAKTALANSGVTASKMFACYGKYPAFAFDSSHSASNCYGSYRINPSSMAIDYSINAAAQAMDGSSVTFGASAFTGGANNLYRGQTYNYYAVEITD